MGYTDRSGVSQWTSQKSSQQAQQRVSADVRRTQRAIPQVDVLHVVCVIMFSRSCLVSICGIIKWTVLSSLRSISEIFKIFDSIGITLFEPYWFCQTFRQSFQNLYNMHVENAVQVFYQSCRIHYQWNKTSMYCKPASKKFSRDSRASLSLIFLAQTSP